MDLALIGIVILLLPVVAFAILALFHNYIPRHGDWLGTGLMFFGLCLAFYVLANVATSDRDFNANPAALTCEWLTLDAPVEGVEKGVAASGAVVIGMQIDNLTAIMLVVVMMVSFSAHLFSIGYMHGDAKYGRYYASLAVFTASMLGLVLSDNLLSLYISWEIMGLASYILIGHYIHKPSANNASLKAFITTRIGDVGMFIAILILYWQVGSFRFDEIFAAVKEGGVLYDGNVQWFQSLRFWCALGLFFGAMGKSAQFPLHVWLPDAMEGPTPVSALIHAATMVAAGVYLVGRAYVLFPPEALLVVAYIGGFTACMAATIAIVQTDIKRVLAYSTVSQLGYMMLGLGCFGYYAGLGHLTTHAFFKACLFLGSGSVIHAMHHNQEMSKYGGLWRKMPVTFLTFLVATFALTGFPYLFSGFHTKDAIIAKAIEFGMIRGGVHQVLGYMATGAALLTSFYMFRLIFLTFFGKPKDEDLHERAHESPLCMTVPLLGLAFLSLWFVGGPVFLGSKTNVVERMLAMPPQKEAELSRHIASFTSRRHGAHDGPARASEEEAEAHDAPAGGGEHPVAAHHGLSPYAHVAHVRAVGGSLVVFPLGVLIAALFYFWRVFSAQKVAAALSPIYVFLRELWFIDHFYRVAVIRPFMWLCAFWGGVDKYVVDGAVYLITWLTRFKTWVIGLFDNLVIDGAYNGGAWLTRWIGRETARAQTGRVRAYLFTIVLGAVALAAIFVFV